jgi:hypothetical protein
VLAARGRRALDGPEEVVEDRNTRTAQRRRGANLVARGLLLAAAVSALLWVLPL